MGILHISDQNALRACWEQNGNSALVTRKDPAEFFLRAARIRHGMFDFDGTLHRDNQWRDTALRMPEELQKEELADLAWNMAFRHRPADHLAKHADDWLVAGGSDGKEHQAAIEGAWMTRGVTRFALAGLKLTDFESVARGLRIREGVPELFGLLSLRVVVSMGMEQLIRTFLITHGLEAHVGATRLVFNKKDRVRGTHPYVMPGCIKSVAVRRFYKAFPEAKPEQLLCIGDTPSDVDLMHEGSLNIFILPPAEEYPEMHAYRSSHLEEMWNVADGFVLGTSLLPLVRFLHEALKENIARALL